MLWSIIQSFVRHSLTSAGAVLVTRGLATQADTDTAVGALMVLIGFGHSIIQKWNAKPASTPSAGSGGSAPLLLVALMAGGALFFTVGCKTTTQQATYQAAGTAIVTVDTAMNLWGTYVAAEHPGTNAELAVESAYEKYQTSMAVVCDAGEAYAATGGTNATAVAALDQAIANSSQELTDLESLISSYGVKLQ